MGDAVRVARRDATECHIYSVGLNIFVLIEFEIVAALQNQKLLRKPRALLVRCGEGSVSCGCCTAVRRAGRYGVGVSTNRQGLRYPRTAAARPKGSEANCQSEGEPCSHGCDHPLASHATRFRTFTPVSLEFFAGNRGANPQCLPLKIVRVQILAGFCPHFA